MPKDITSRFPEFEKFITFGIYYPVYSGISDNLSKSVLDLKSGDANSISRWGNYIRESGNIPKLFLVRALGHNELRAGGNEPLDKLAQIIAEDEMEILFLKNNGLSKNRQTESLKALGPDARRAELDGVFSFFTSSTPETRNSKIEFVIFDDIVTTGTTIKAIASAIRKSWPNALFWGFSLLETYNSRQPQDYDNDSVFNHIFNQTVNHSNNNNEEPIDYDETMDAYMQYSREEDYNRKNDDNDEDLPF